MSKTEHQLLRRIVDLDPIIIIGQCDDDTYCFFCHNDFYQYFDEARPPQHNPDCIWLLAKKYIDELNQDTVATAEAVREFGASMKAAYDDLEAASQDYLKMVKRDNNQ